jgi:hypothetical protein
MMKPDLYTNAVLTVIALLLAVLALRPAAAPPPVLAQANSKDIYIEPGIVGIRRPDGSSMGEGRMVVDLRTGAIWGFPSNVSGSPYPVDTTSTKGALSKAVYLGRFDFDSMKLPQ